MEGKQCQVSFQEHFTIYSLKTKGVQAAVPQRWRETEGEEGMKKLTYLRTPRLPCLENVLPKAATVFVLHCHLSAVYLFISLTVYPDKIKKSENVAL